MDFRKAVVGGMLSSRSLPERLQLSIFVDQTWTYRAPLERISLGMTSQFTRHSAEEERNRGQYANVPSNDL